MSYYLGIIVIFSLLKFTRSDKFLASCSSDKTIKTWDIKSQSLIRTLIGHTSSVWGLEVLNNGYVASCSTDLTIKIWDPSSGQLVKNLTGHTSTVWNLAELQNGYLASSSSDRTIKNGEIHDNLKIIKLKLIFIHHQAIIVACCFFMTNDEFFLIKISFNKIFLFSRNIDNGQIIRSITGHTDLIWGLKVLRNSFLASSTLDKTIKIWNTDDGSTLLTLVWSRHFIHFVLIDYYLALFSLIQW